MIMEGLEKNTIKAFAKRCMAMFAVLSLSLTAITAAFHDARAATPPRILMYQGRLLNSNGVPLSDSTATMSFALYDASSAGTCLWSNNSDTCASVTTRSVTLTAGLFSEALGDTGASYAAIAESVFMNNATVYLEVTVNGETLTPRKQMLAAPYAMNSDSLDGYGTTTSGATSSKVPVFDTSGNLVITGAPQGTGVSQGSLYVNPASAGVAANEILLGVAVEGSSRFSVDEDGDTSVAGNLMVGGSTLAAPFSVDYVNGIVNVGDGTSTNSIIDFRASDGSTGRFSYIPGDSFRVTDGYFSYSGPGTLPSLSSEAIEYFSMTEAISGTSGNNLSTIGMYGTYGEITYSGIEGSGTTAHEVNSIEGLLSISGASSTLTWGSAIEGSVTNTSTNASLLQSNGFLTGVTGNVTHNGTGTTIGDVRGVYGLITSLSGTITDAFAVIGRFSTPTGSVTNGYAIYGKNTEAGTQRYGVYGQASGGTNNYAGYFTGAQVQIDTDTTPDTPTLADGTGDLYISDDLEVRGDVLFHEIGAMNTFTFRSSLATTQAAAQFITDGLTSGVGLRVVRGDDAGVAFTGNVVHIEQDDFGSDNSGTALQIDQAGGGTAVGLRITQSTTSAHVANSTGNNALVIDVNEAASTDNAIVMRSDADGTADTEFRVTTAGDAYADGAFTGAGADFAEYFPTNDATLDDFHLACIDASDAESVKRCEAGNHEIVGVISTNPAFIGNLVGDGTEDYRNDARYRLVGLTGQIDTLVTTADGAIAVGDPITTSSSAAGYGAKAFGPVRIAGFALEALASGTGTIRVLVSPQWYGSDVLSASGSSTDVSGNLGLRALQPATASSPLADSSSLLLKGSVWNGAGASDRAMGMKTVVSAVDDYRLSIMNTGDSEVASINDDGDMMISGKLYPSDRGVMQQEKYIYYDGSEGGGGDFMRTNASGWSTGSYDFAEMFPSPDALSPGELVVFGDGSEQIKRSPGETYSPTIAGIVSTRPGFLAGENRSGSYPIALAGRVPTYVSAENGPINIGDPLTSSSRPGYAMKATKPGPIVGYAAQAFSGTTGSIVVYVNVSHYNGAPTAEAPAANNSISKFSDDVEQFDTNGVLNFRGGQLIAIGSMGSANATWRLETSGDFITSGRVIQLVKSGDGRDVETYPVTSREMTVQLAGSVRLNGGTAEVLFADVDSEFTNIVDSVPTYRAFVTPHAATGALFVTERTVHGFTIMESGSQSVDVEVDWMVIAYRRDFAPIETPVIDDAPAQENSVPDAASSDESGVSSENVASDDVQSVDPVPSTDVVVGNDTVTIDDPLLTAEPDANAGAPADSVPSSETIDSAVSDPTL